MVLQKKNDNVKYFENFWWFWGIYLDPTEFLLVPEYGWTNHFPNLIKSLDSKHLGTDSSIKILVHMINYEVLPFY